MGTKAYDEIPQLLAKPLYIVISFPVLNFILLYALNIIIINIIRITIFKKWYKPIIPPGISLKKNFLKIKYILIII